MKKVKRRKRVKTQDLHLRVTEREKNRLSKEAGELGVSVSAYVRPLIFGKRTKLMPSREAIQAVALCQDIVTYVQEKYGCEDDIELAERMDNVWSVL